jgi:hypothetical protein
MTDPQRAATAALGSSFCLFDPGFRSIEKVEKSWLTSEWLLFRSAAPDIAAKTSREFSGAMLV